MFSSGCNPLEFIDEEGEAEDDKEGNKGPDESINEDVLNIFEELFFFEVIATGKYHGGQQGQEEKFLTELELRKIMGEVNNNSKQEADEYPCTCLMDVVEL